MSGPTTDPHEPASPWGENGRALGGLTKRELIAAMLMQGLANGYEVDGVEFDVLARDSVSAADALIEQLNK